MSKILKPKSRILKYSAGALSYALRERLRRVMSSINSVKAQPVKNIKRTGSGIVGCYRLGCGKSPFLQSGLRDPSERLGFCLHLGTLTNCCCEAFAGRRCRNE